MKKQIPAFACLIIGSILMLFSNGRWTIPAATWFCPIFFLRFFRLQKPGRGFLYLALVSSLLNAIVWWKMIPVPVFAYFIITCIFLQSYTLCYLADRLIAARMKGFLSTLIFPACYTTVEFLTSFSADKASNLALAYTQLPNLPVMQLTSVVGIWGISFLITWFASVVNWMWQQEFKWSSIRSGALISASVLAVVFLFGTVRLFVHLDMPTVRTASIVQSRSLNDAFAECLRTKVYTIGNFSNDVQTNLLSKTEEAARSGAKIVLWQEGASWLPQKEEANLILKARNLAAKEKIYLLMSMWVLPPNFPHHLAENKILTINPKGEIEATYLKSHPVRGAELIVKGDGNIHAIQTPYGLIANAICFDADFPDFIRQVGNKNVCILFLPANDWKAIDPYHTQLALVRAIENGCSLVRAAGQGLSVTSDNRGRIISSMDFYSTNKQIMYANVPILHSTTLYPIIGDSFAWLCIGYLITILSVGLFRKFLQSARQRVYSFGK